MNSKLPVREGEVLPFFYGFSKIRGKIHQMVSNGRNVILKLNLCSLCCKNNPYPNSHLNFIDLWSIIIHLSLKYARHIFWPYAPDKNYSAAEGIMQVYIWYFVHREIEGLLLKEGTELKNSLTRTNNGSWYLLLKITWKKKKGKSEPVLYIQTFYKNAWKNKENINLTS